MPPHEPRSVEIAFSTDPNTSDAIDAFRAARDLPSRSAAVHALVREGLRAQSPHAPPGRAGVARRPPEGAPVTAPLRFDPPREADGTRVVHLAAPCDLTSVSCSGAKSLEYVSEAGDTLGIQRPGIVRPPMFGVQTIVVREAAPGSSGAITVTFRAPRPPADELQIHPAPWNE